MLRRPGDGAIARAFAREGATVHLAGRTLAPLERVAGQVRAAGGTWPSELGPAGIRMLTLQTGGVPETIPQGAEGMRGVIDGLVNATMLKRAATLERDRPRHHRRLGGRLRTASASASSERRAPATNTSRSGQVSRSTTTVRLNCPA
jgi:hypothetical protein